MKCSAASRLDPEVAGARKSRRPIPGSKIQFIPGIDRYMNRRRGINSHQESYKLRGRSTNPANTRLLIIPGIGGYQSGVESDGFPPECTGEKGACVDAFRLATTLPCGASFRPPFGRNLWPSQIWWNSCCDRALAGIPPCAALACLCLPSPLQQQQH